MNRKHIAWSVNLDIPWPSLPGISARLRWLLPTPGNVLFTLLVVAGLLWANSVGALPLRAPAAAGASTGTIAYQGRLADADGTPITDTVNMIFRLYDVASGGVFLWEEQWTGSNGVRVSDGLFNVMLGSLTSIPQSVITGHDSLFLGITVGTDDEMTPRVQLGSVPFAVQALTVPEGSITTAKIADGAVAKSKLAANAVAVLPQIRLRKSANQAIPYRTTMVVSWDIEDFKTDLVHSNTTNNSRITIGTPGLYYISALVRWEYDGGGRKFCHLNVNGSPVSSTTNEVHSAGSSYRLTCSTQAILRLTPNDYVEVAVWQEAAASLDISIGGAAWEGDTFQCVMLSGY